MLHVWVQAEAQAHLTAGDKCRLLWVAKGQEAMGSSACERKESQAEPSEILANRLDILSMMYHEPIIVSSGFSKQQEFGLQHTSRREGARQVRQLASIAVLHGHRGEER